MIAPKGAPTRNKSKQAIAKLIFLCHSILCLVMMILRYSKSSLFDFVIDLSMKAYEGMWIANMVFSLIALFLIYKAKNDVQLFDFSPLLKRMNQILKKKEIQ